MNPPPPPPEPKLLVAKDEDGNWLSLEFPVGSDGEDVLRAFEAIWVFLGYDPVEIHAYG